MSACFCLHQVLVWSGWFHFHANFLQPNIEIHHWLQDIGMVLRASKTMRGMVIWCHGNVFGIVCLCNANSLGSGALGRSQNNRTPDLTSCPWAHCSSIAPPTGPHQDAFYLDDHQWRPTLSETLRTLSSWLQNSKVVYRCRKYTVTLKTNTRVLNLCRAVPCSWGIPNIYMCVCVCVS